MTESVALLRGVVKGGVIVPDGPPLPDGAAVEFRLLPTAFTPEEQAEYDGWEQLGDEALGTIDWGEGEIARDSG